MTRQKSHTVEFRYRAVGVRKHCAHVFRPRQEEEARRYFFVLPAVAYDAFRCDDQLPVFIMMPCLPNAVEVIDERILRPGHRSETVEVLHGKEQRAISDMRQRPIAPL